MKTRLVYFLPLVATVALIVFGEALSDLWKEDVKALFQQNKWLLLAFVLLLTLVGILWESLAKREKTAIPEKVDVERYDEAFGKFKALLLEQYQLRLQAKIAKRLPINLSAKSTDFGMNPERVKTFFQDQTIESEDIASEIDKILRMHDRLLLIGEPGAGKTTVLLFAALNILRNEENQAAKLPLILNLATWNKGRDFGEWYGQSIAHTCNLSPVFVRGLLEQNAVVPFFDGFDEISEDARDECFRKMRAYFGDAHNRQLIVSSRKKEYAAAKEDAPVFAEIEVLPLSLAQIKKALSENATTQAGERALLDAFERDEYLAQAVETPFYLNTASFLFGNKLRTLAEFPFSAKSVEGRQAELVQLFATEQVPDPQDQKHLSFLAGKMNEENFMVFELLKMQPRWCVGRWRYVLSCGLVLGLVFAFAFALVLGLAIGLVFALVLGLASGLVLGLFFGLFNRIRSADILILSWGEFKKDWWLSLVGGLIGSLPGSLIGNLIGSLVGGFVVGFVFGSIFFLVNVCTKTQFLLSITYPYQRFKATFFNDFWGIPALLLAFAAGIYAQAVWNNDFYYLDELISGLQDWDNWFIILQMGLLLLVAPLKNSHFPEHFALRLVLYYEGKMPLRVVRFMDRMSEQHIFEDNRRTVKGKKQRGAAWRFRHKILQDYFAAQSKDTSLATLK